MLHCLRINTQSVTESFPEIFLGTSIDLSFPFWSFPQKYTSYIYYSPSRKSFRPHKYLQHNIILHHTHTYVVHILARAFLITAIENYRSFGSYYQPSVGRRHIRRDLRASTLYYSIVLWLSPLPT